MGLRRFLLFLLNCSPPGGVEGKNTLTMTMRQVRTVTGTQGTVPGDLDLMRARVYRLLAALLIRPPPPELLDMLAKLSGDPDTPFGRACTGLGRAAATADPAETEREFNRLFIGLERGELMPYASHYRTGHLYGPPLIDIREDMARLGLARDQTVREPEDHAAVMLEIMADLIDGAHSGAAASLEVQQDAFRRHIGPWLPRFMRDLEQAREASFYRPVGTLGSGFLEVEAQAFDLPEETAR